VCPRCGSSVQMRTARELFDMMNGAQAQTFQRLNQSSRTAACSARPHPVSRRSTTRLRHQVPDRTAEEGTAEEGTVLAP